MKSEVSLSLFEAFEPAGPSTRCAKATWELETKMNPLKNSTIEKKIGCD